MHESVVLGVGLYRVQIHDQTLQSHDMKLQAIARQATFEQDCEPILQSGLG
jgi:hypothetical protein